MDIKNKNQKKHNINVELDVNTQKANNLETSIDNAEIKALIPKKNVGGAPRKDQSRKSTERYSFYCTPAESKKLRAMAEKCDMKIAEFIKFKVFDKYRNS